MLLRARMSLLMVVAATSLAVAQSRPTGALRPIDYRETGPVRHGRSHRHAAQRSEVFRAPERPAGQARVAAARRQGRIAQRSRRSARARAPDRAHGVQRQRAFQAGRAGVVLRDGRRAPRAARQRVYELRRNGVHVRRAERQAGNRRKGADRAGRFRRRPDAVAAGSRQGTRRRDRGVARRPRRRIAHPRQAVSDSVLQVALRRAAADRQAGHHPQRAGRAAARVLRHLVSPGSHGGRCGRRHRRRPKIEQSIQDRVHADQGAGGRGQPPDRTVPLHKQPLVSVVDRSGGDAVERLDRAQAAARERARTSATTAVS